MLTLKYTYLIVSDVDFLNHCEVSSAVAFPVSGKVEWIVKLCEWNGFPKIS
jgi:hypothetical protein